jgi:hypothetical protein
MWALGFINRWCILRGHFRVREVDFPRADRERLRMAVNADTAAFIGPNHPEFGLDWMMDKEVSTLVAPRMASWASHGIVRSAPGFWTRNNLIANNGGDAATEYSVRWALEGHGVLLHPEGMVNWTADTVHPLFPGIADLAIEAARRVATNGDDRRVFIAPIVWKYRYTGDISDALVDEMRYIESELGLLSREGLTVGERFRSLQDQVLARQMAMFGFDARSVRTLDFFARQETFRGWLVGGLQERHDVEPGESIARTIHRLERAISAKRKVSNTSDLEMDTKRVAEAARLGGFGRAWYGSPSLSQEQIAESLKRMRAALVRRGLRNAVHNMLPAPLGDRVAHVRVPEPIAIDLRRASSDGDDRRAYARYLVEAARVRMQEKLDAINRQVSSETAKYRHPNPFFELC